MRLANDGRMDLKVSVDDSGSSGWSFAIAVSGRPCFVQLASLFPIHSRNTHRNPYPGKGVVDL